LFRYDKTTKVKRTLMVFIHPTIISSPYVGRQVSQSKYTFLQEQQDKMNNVESVEIVPELDDFPEPPVPPAQEQHNPDSENDPDPQSDDENQ